MADARVFAAGVQRLYTVHGAVDQARRVFALGVQVIRGTGVTPPGPTGRRRQQQNVT